MHKSFTDCGFEDYLYWQAQDKKTLRKINELIKDIERNGAAKGIGKPEPLKYRPGWSRRIDDANRFVYDVSGDNLYIIFCKGHYGDK